MTDTATVTLAEFLLARIADDEQTAREASRRNDTYVETGVHWRWVDPETDEPIRMDPMLDEYHFGASLRSVEVFPTQSVGPLPQFAIAATEDLPTVVGMHIARWDPARVLAECEAKRRIVELTTGKAYGWIDVQMALALPYADHPDFDESWRV